MLRATVDQKPTMPVRDGTKKAKNSPGVWNLPGELRTGPKPPALPAIQKRSRRPTLSMRGAPTPSRKRIVSIPRQTTSILRSQKAKKQIQIAPGKAAVDGET